MAYTEQDIRRIAWGTHVDFPTTTTPHHAQSHTLTGSDHTAASLTAGDIFEATSATAFGFVGRILKAYRTADGTAVTNTTLTNDPVLTLTLAASSNYDFKILGFSSNAGAAEGIKVALSGTVGVTHLKAQIYIYDDTLNTLVAFARVTALGSSVGAGLSSGDNFFEIRGSIETSTTGTFLLQSAQNAAGASAGVTVQRASSLIALRVS